MSLHCHICSRDFQERASLARHYYEDHDAVYCCQYCSSQFRSSRECDDHVNQLHASRACFPCLFCCDKSRMKKDLLRHQRETHTARVAESTCNHCKIIMPDKNCLNLHVRYCPGKPLPRPLLHKQYQRQQQEQRQQEQLKRDPDATPSRNRSLSEGRSPRRQSGRPSSNSGALSASSNGASVSASYICNYCPQQFASRKDHCRHMISVHQAGVLCSFCHVQLVAPPGDDVTASAVYKEHLERNHRMVRHWICIYCCRTFDNRRLLMDHQHADHTVIKCPLCTTLAPTLDVCGLHKEFQHRFLGTKPICTCCFKRVPENEFRQHLSDHSEEERPSISCNECFEFITNQGSLDQHLACFDKEARRFNDFVAGKNDRYIKLCYCGFCAANQYQLNQHNGWCHKETKCPMCRVVEFGYAGMKRHKCTAVPNGMPAVARVPPHCAPMDPLSQEAPDTGTSSLHQRQSIDSPNRLRTQSVTVIVANPTPLPIATASNCDGNDVNMNMESLNSLEEIVVKEEEESILIASESANEETASKDTPAPSTIGKATQAAAHSRKQSTSSSSSSSSSDDEASMPPAKRPSAKGNATQSETAILKRPRIQATRRRSSTSTSSSDSEAEEPTASGQGPRKYPQATSTAALLATNSPSESSSSVSSSEDEQPPSNKSGQVATPVITSVFSVKDAEAALNKTKKGAVATLKVPPTRQNLFSAASIARCGIDEANVEEDRSKRKSTDGNANIIQLEYVCTLCNHSSLYRGSVLRHLEIIHRLRPDMCQEFCQAQQRRQPVVMEPQSPRVIAHSNTRSIGIEANKACSECKIWNKKIQLYENVLSEVVKHAEKAKRKISKV